MNIAVIGTGYVGLVSGACFAEMGLNVTCIDIDSDKIEKLNQGIIPIYEPGLQSIVTKNHEAKRLHFTTELKSVINKVSVIFIAVGTPSDEEGNADLSSVYDVARSIADHMQDYHLIVTKSTVPVGTTAKIKKLIKNRLSERNLSHIKFDIASNPEFLKEGAAVQDFMNPDRVVVGVENGRAKEIMSKLYRPFLLNNFRVIFMDIHSSEMTKYASNAMLATRISFMNDIANLCEIVGADVSMVRSGVGSDPRIGKSFLYPGAGYGGSCFPKDIKALIRTAENVGYDMRILKAVKQVNDDQKEILFRKLMDHFDNEVSGLTIAVWGLAFKPGTDDMREAPSITLIQKLIDNNVRVRVYDPVAMDVARNHFGDKVEYSTDIYDAANDAHAVVLVTEWKEFRIPNWDVLNKVMKNLLIIDGRNIYNVDELASKGFTYSSIGRK
ncbi:MAG TPA: UDP-glucose/GDP-mannose dehydrogenase family protein [Dysgonamonadaceae bacterium]|jgi:UDPglucose 6-dehydrogenase|nr:UDP-glucose/GDP-mannose dehydrogenase family protein [Dysgonamonadaceae bacterium]